MIEKGTIITCPNCRVELFSLTSDVINGTFIKESLFKPLNQTIVNGDMCTCKKCGDDWFVSGKLHTKDGWRS